MAKDNIKEFLIEPQVMCKKIRAKKGFISEKDLRESGIYSGDFKQLVFQVSDGSHVAGSFFPGDPDKPLTLEVFDHNGQLSANEVDTQSNLTYIGRDSCHVLNLHVSHE